jgi:hypothetical protein
MVRLEKNVNRCVDKFVKSDQSKPSTQENVMRQNTELASVKARIKALAAKTVAQGCSEAEAMNAAAMVGQLLQRYNLSMEEIDVREQKCITLSIPTGSARKGAMNWCVSSIARFADCKVWYSRRYTGGGFLGKREFVWNFFGQETDLEVVKYLYEVIQAAFQRETKAFKNTDTYRATLKRASASTSFQHGMADRIATRLTEMKRENDRALREAHQARMKEAAQRTDFAVATAHSYTPRERQAAQVTGTALIVLKHQLVEQEFKQAGVKLGKASSYRRLSDGRSYSKGHEAGSRVNLNRPIGNGSSIAGYLK